MFTDNLISTSLHVTKMFNMDGSNINVNMMMFHREHSASMKNYILSFELYKKY